MIEPPAPTVTDPTPPSPDAAATRVISGSVPLLLPATDPTERALPDVPGYVLLGELGRGGMGVVYKALQSGLGRIVALKMIRAGASASRGELTRFAQEAEALARLKHPHIVQIFQVGELEGQPFFSLEYLEGGSLAHRLKSAPQPAQTTAQLMRTLAQAVQAAHQAGVVHRDLKPANVLLTRDGQPKVTDFGLAKRLDVEAGQTPTQAVMGTPSYMAPEQAEGRSKQVQPAADIYALGAMLYEMLTGRPPFVGESVMDTILQVLHNEPIPPSRLQPKVPRDLETICLKCLHKAPGRRYASAQELAKDLERYLTGEPIRARPTPWWERLGKWTRRHPARAGLAAVALLALVGFGLAIHFRAESWKKEWEKEKAQSQERDIISENLDRIEDLVAGQRWTAADKELASQEAILARHEDPRAEHLRDKAQRLHEMVQAGLLKEKRKHEADARPPRFRPAHAQAMFHQVQPVNLNLPKARGELRKEAQKALAIYALDRELAPGEVSLLEQDRPLLDAAEFTRLAWDCYELLLLWAEASLADQETETARILLNSAHRLGEACGLKTRAWHRLRAELFRRDANRGGLEDERPPLSVAVDPVEPTVALDLFLEALESYRADRIPQARQACDKVLAQQNDHFWARYLLALCHLRQRAWSEARGELTVCANLRRDFAWSRLMRGFASSEWGHLANLPAEFARAEEDFDWALRQDQSPEVQYVGLVNRGALYLRQQRWSDAERDLRAAIRISSEGFQAHANLAQALRMLKRPGEALASLDLAIQRADRPARLYGTRARLHLEQHHWTPARADLEHAIELQQKEEVSEQLLLDLVELGKLLYREGQFVAALARCNQALCLQDDFVLAERFRAEPLLALERYEEAGVALDRYLAAARNVSAAVYWTRGMIHARAGQLAAAIDLYSAAARLDPRETTDGSESLGEHPSWPIRARSSRGWAYFQVNAVPLALADFEACLKERPDHPEYLAGRASARIRLAKLPEALADAERAAAKLGPQPDRRVLYHLACVYAQAAALAEAEARPNRATAGSGRSVLFWNRALDYLQRTAEAVPVQQRPAFWRDQVETDPALAFIRRGAAYAQLAQRYGH